MSSPSVRRVRGGCQGRGRRAWRVGEGQHDHAERDATETCPGWSSRRGRPACTWQIGSGAQRESEPIVCPRRAAPNTASSPDKGPSGAATKQDVVVSLGATAGAAGGATSTAAADMSVRGLAGHLVSRMAPGERVRQA
jgi:hypothetical protein